MKKLFPEKAVSAAKEEVKKADESSSRAIDEDSTP